MNEAMKQQEQVTQTSAEDMEAGWQTPQYVVVETALEVTAYSLATR
ncbi:pyrroloquinoline quinone precursor peptide PqqA [Streptomyces sp. A3M-1-3]|nr:pyrroloquinoline quinone precursor peptide PqqA [Streptomyces sp. A3M-1-3]MCP3821712.1 pyrroloquinoline quinone precursor peptide PqqA [Streptomyces sp. A3M-1-3]